MPYFIAGPCIDVMDKSCIEECPVEPLGSPGQREVWPRGRGHRAGPVMGRHLN